MKKLLIPSIILAFAVVSCQSPPPPPPEEMEEETIDLAAIEKEVGAFIESYNENFQGRKADEAIAMLADDGLFAGTDPKEVVNKETISEMMRQMLADTTLDLTMNPQLTEIKVAADGKSAIILEQTQAINWAPNIPIRVVSQVRATDDGWKVSFMSWSFLMNNEDVAGVNDMLGNKEE